MCWLLIVNPRDQLEAAQELYGRAPEPYVEARVLREQHLVARLDAARIRSDRGHDSGPAAGLVARGDDQTGARLGLLVTGLDHDEVVERLERQIDPAWLLQHIANDTAVVRVGGHEVTVSNPDKPFFPERGLTKGDLVDYYVGLAGSVLPHLRRRPFHMKRFTDGVAGEFFHQKRVPKGHPAYVDEVHVEFPSGHSTDFAIVDNAAALAWVVNLGCIELHTWHSRVPDIERPDYLLIDLDPTTDGQWPFVREIALVVREVMDELGLASFPKTSGATGLHILAPIKPELVFPEVRRFAKALAQEVERRVGDQAVATTTWKVADRVGVFVDFGQNARDRTIASAYSIRPMPDARASAPLAWDEVSTVEPEAFTLKTLPARVAEIGDLTRGMWRRKRSLVPLFERLGLDPPVSSAD
jgi:bifunctional non-homologous end joining protein LigD